MMATLAPIALAALLFVVFGMQRSRPGCGGDCGQCDETCTIREMGNEND